MYMTSLRWLLPLCRGQQGHESSTAPQLWQWLRDALEGSAGLVVGYPPTMELDQEQQPELELGQAFVQLMDKHKVAQVRKRM